MSDETHDLSEFTHQPHTRAEIVFAVVSFGVALVLAALWSTETTWIDGQPWSRQPGLWPLIAVVGMLLFGAGELVTCIARNLRKEGGSVLAELGLWARAAEYGLWFMAYVLATPWIGYLPATVIFTTALSLRLGYRGRIVWLSPLVALGIVLLFKTFLSVRIPGGEIYELFPQAIRNFLVIYL